LWGVAAWAAVFAACARCLAADGPPRTNRGVHVFSWTTVAPECRHITPMVAAVAAENPDDVAAKLRLQPPGRRGMLVWDLHKNLTNHPLDLCRAPDGRPTDQHGVWPERGIRQVQERCETYFRRIQLAGVSPDVVAVDYEENYSWQGITAHGPKRAQAIAADPRFRALSEKIGFSDLTKPFYENREYKQWNSELSKVFDAALEEALFEPLRRCFPEVECSNYGSYTITRPNMVPHFADETILRESPGCGTHQSADFFGMLGGFELRKVPTAGGGDRQLGFNGYTALLLSVNQIRAMRRSSPRPVQPWIASCNYDQDYEGYGRRSGVRNTPYYDELIRHLVLHDCDRILLWNPVAFLPQHRNEDWNRPEDALRVDRVAGDLDARLAGTWSGTATLAPVPWESPVCATGLNVGDRTIWRLSLAPGMKSARISIGGEETTIAPADGEAGAWLTTARGIDIRAVSGP
jgi:hypothetical protein